MKSKKGKIKFNIYDIFYVARVIATFLMLLLLILLLPNIFKASHQGYLFLFVAIFLIILILWLMLIKKEKLKKNFTFNLLYILAVCYLGLVFVRLYFDERMKLTMIYEVDMNYLKNNYIFLSIIFIGIIIHGILILLDEKNVKN